MNKTQKLTRTAVLLAITLIFQALRFIPFIGASPYASYIIGSLVNLSLIMSVLTASLSTAIFISIVTPIVAFIQGHLNFPLMIPVVALGNIILCAGFYYVGKFNKYAGIIVGGLLKWAFLYNGVAFVFSNFITVPPQKLSILIATFNVPQIVTALIGGFLALTLYRLLPESVKK